MPTKRKPHGPQYTEKKPFARQWKVELTGAKVHVWITIPGKTQDEVDFNLHTMSKRTLLRLVRAAQGRTRVMGLGHVHYLDVLHEEQ